MSSPSPNKAVPVRPALLRRWPLPQPGKEGDKDARGRILVVAGAGEMPGAALLAAVGALRAGAGKLQVATCASAAPLVAAAVPEARVIALPETRGGALAAAAGAKLSGLSERADAIVVGPGLLDSAAMARMLARWLVGLPAIPVVIDAAALTAFDAGADVLANAPLLRIITPHAGEAARLMGVDRDEVEAHPQRAAVDMAQRFNAVCVMKGATTYIADGPALESGERNAFLSNRYGNVGLATSGSGDTLAGIVGGLAARGAPPLQAAAWGVYLHAAAADALEDRQGGPLGFLARELLDQVPRVMNALTPAQQQRERPRP